MKCNLNKEERIQMKISNLYQKICSIRLRWIFLIAFLMSIGLFLYSANAVGGVKEAFRYQEENYCMLVQEVNNCIVPEEDISIEHLKGSDILYKKEYLEETNTSGIYKLTLTCKNTNFLQPDDCQVIATISEDIDLHTLTIERNYTETELLTCQLCLIIFYMSMLCFIVICIWWVIRLPFVIRNR